MVFDSPTANELVMWIRIMYFLNQHRLLNEVTYPEQFHDVSLGFGNVQCLNTAGTFRLI